MSQFNYLWNHGSHYLGIGVYLNLPNSLLCSAPANNCVGKVPKFVYMAIFSILHPQFIYALKYNSFAIFLSSSSVSELNKELFKLLNEAFPCELF
jgi:hypothetical protein